MRVVLQRVSSARVIVEGAVVGEIDRGLLLLVAFAPEDGEDQLTWMVDRITGLRIFPDEEGRMNRGIADVGGAMLVVSQFTLYGDARKGRRPSFVGAAGPDVAMPLYERFVEMIRATGLPTATGRFGAMMSVELTNDGPVTLILDR